MGNKIESKKNLDDLKKHIQALSDEDLARIKGGNKTSSNNWSLSLGAITPQ